jgi:hypothetical protein
MTKGSAATIEGKDHSAICRTTQYIDIPTLSRLLSSLECFNNASPSNGTSSSQFVPLAILTLVAEYSQHFQRLYAFASIGERLGSSTDRYRFYIMEGLPSNKYESLPLLRSNKDGADNTNDEMNGRMNDWRRVVMTTKAAGEGELPYLFAYHDWIISAWPGQDLIQPYLCRVPSPCIMAPPRSKGTAASPVEAKKGAVPIEGNDVMRVTCGRWTQFESGFLGVTRRWSNYRFIDIIECPSDMNEENRVNPPSLQAASYPNGKKAISHTDHPRYWWYIAANNRIDLYYIDHKNGAIDTVNSNKIRDDQYLRIASRYEQIIYLFTQTPKRLWIITYDTLRAQWNDLQSMEPPEHINNIHCSITIPKCGILMYSCPEDPPRRLLPDNNATMLYHPMSHQWTVMDWIYPEWKAANDESDSLGVGGQRSMVWYNNTILLVPLKAPYIPIWDMSIEVTRCYMLAPHLITRHYTPVPLSSSSSSSSTNGGIGSGIDKSSIGDMMVTITLPQKVALKDWIRIDDLPSYTDRLSMYATSFY